jgi:uncharacterized OB-fold protein
MNWEPPILPDVTPETVRFWSAAADGRLLLNRCNDCELVYYYPRAICPECFSDDIAWVDCEGAGEVYTYSTLELLDGWPDEAMPLIVAFVELDEGPRICSNIVNCEPDEINVGSRVRARFIAPESEEAIGIPVFEPVK